MDTRNKSNAEFRNEVNEALARHESSLDQVHATLQTIMADIQSMRVPHSPNSNPTETNPFAPNESTRHPIQPNSHATSQNDRSHHHLKLSFPKFNGEDPTG